MALDVLADLGGRAFLSELTRLATISARLCGAGTRLLRLEHVDHDACRCMHADAVGWRLLCTYASQRTEWQDAGGTIRRMTSGRVGIFKGSAWSDPCPRILQRSLPVSHLPQARRSRLLLCLDQIG